MEAIEFVKALRERVVEETYKDYCGLFSNNPKATDPLWRDILLLYQSMDKEQQMIFLQFLRMIQVNTLSHVLGIIDGSTYLTQSNEHITLKVGQSENAISGSLQDFFLGLEEGDYM